VNGGRGCKGAGGSWEEIRQIWGTSLWTASNLHRRTLNWIWNWTLEVRVAGLIFFIFLNEIRRGILEMERVSFTVNGQLWGVQQR